KTNGIGSSTRSWRSSSGARVSRYELLAAGATRGSPAGVAVRARRAAALPRDDARRQGPADVPALPGSRRGAAGARAANRRAARRAAQVRAERRGDVQAAVARG